MLVILIFLALILNSSTVRFKFRSFQNALSNLILIISVQLLTAPTKPATYVGYSLKNNESFDFPKRMSKST